MEGRRQKRGEEREREKQLERQKETKETGRKKEAIGNCRKMEERERVGERERESKGTEQWKERRVERDKYWESKGYIIRRRKTNRVEIKQRKEKGRKIRNTQRNSEG